jgi:hypothetical protein
MREALPVRGFYPKSLLSQQSRLFHSPLRTNFQKGKVAVQRPNLSLHCSHSIGCRQRVANGFSGEIEVNLPFFTRDTWDEPFLKFRLKRGTGKPLFCLKCETSLLIRSLPLKMQGTKDGEQPVFLLPEADTSKIASTYSANSSWGLGARLVHLQFFHCFQANFGGMVGPGEP